VKYAIISDIHGNIHALEAVLADAEAQGADRYLLIGDYASNFPFGNEVVTAIRGIKNATVIRGNGEDYFTDLQGQDPVGMTSEQFKPVHWSYNALSAENRDYLANLPETATVKDGEATIHLAHSMDLFIRKPPYFSSMHIRRMITAGALTRDEYPARAKAFILADADAAAKIQALPPGVYLFGHNHMQFHMAHEGRLFINPGSCGEPLDGSPTAAYTLLTLSPGGWKVDERRVACDLDLISQGFITSGYAKTAPMWSKIMNLELRTGKDYFSSFVFHLIETGKNMDATGYPVSNEVWEAAVRTWDENKI
jgi:predicted phosphodiesterase